MDEKSLIEIILNGETERIEFKKSTSQLDKSLKTICGFLNHKGGAVYFGVDDKTIVTEYNVSSATAKRELKDMVNKNILKQAGYGRATYYILSDPIMTRLFRAIGIQINVINNSLNK